MSIVAEGVERLWLDTLQQLSARAAHEIKDALNGVSVNLEVVRSRAGQLDKGAMLVVPFADSAAEQLDRVALMTDALLVLARAVREPVDVAMLVGRLAALLGPAAEAEGGALRLEDATGGAPTLTTVRGDVARTVLTAMLTNALAPRRRLDCRLTTTDGMVQVTVRAGDGAALALPPSIATLAEDAGVRIGSGASEIRLALPAL